jgi:tRNA pseudouridine55 synthase
MSAEGGLTLLHKPAGVTSFKVLDAVKRALGTKKVGHAGTLDRFATGLLVVLSGRATKLIRFITGADKTYDAVIRFGVETETLDPEGEVVASADVPDASSIAAAIPRFVGTLQQQPPAYSAVHVDGRRAYQRVRRGEAFDVPMRTVHVYEFEMDSYEAPNLRAKIRCSSGTYVRSLARDLARAADSCGHVVELTRTAVGPFGLGEAVGPQDIDADRDLIPFERFVRRLPGLRIATIDDGGRRRMEKGAKISTDMLLDTADSGYVGNGAERQCAETSLEEGRPLAVFSRSGSFLGVVRPEGSRLRYLFNRGLCSGGGA